MWDQIRVDHEPYVIYARTPERVQKKPIWTTSFTDILNSSEFFLCNDTHLQTATASNVASYINTIIKEG